MREAARAVASTDAPIGADGDSSFGELFAASGPTTEDEVDAVFRGDAVRRAVSKLPERQRDVISLRFGLVGDGPNSLEQVGKQLGITRERVRQIEAEALRRLAEDTSIAAVERQRRKRAPSGARFRFPSELCPVRRSSSRRGPATGSCRARSPSPRASVDSSSSYGTVKRTVVVPACALNPTHGNAGLPSRRTKSS